MGNIADFLKKMTEFSKNNASIEDFAAYVLENFLLNSKVVKEQVENRKPAEKNEQPKVEQPKREKLNTQKYYKEIINKCIPKHSSYYQEDTPIISKNVNIPKQHTEMAQELANKMTSETMSADDPDTIKTQAKEISNWDDEVLASILHDVRLMNDKDCLNQENKSEIPPQNKNERAKKIVDKMISDKMLINDPIEIKRQIEEILKWDNDALDAMERILNKNSTYSTTMNEDCNKNGVVNRSFYKVVGVEENDVPEGQRMTDEDVNKAFEIQDNLQKEEKLSPEEFKQLQVDLETALNQPYRSKFYPFSEFNLDVIKNLEKDLNLSKPSDVVEPIDQPKTSKPAKKRKSAKKHTKKSKANNAA